MLNIKRTQFNRDAVEKMTFKEFKELYEGKFPAFIELEDLFKMNGGKLNSEKSKIEEGE